MDNNRMSTADMLQYCEEALAWEDFGPIDIFFFESVKKILLGQCSALEENEDVIDDLMGIERPVRDVELEPEYGKYADIYYGEEGDDDIPDYSRSKEDEAFDSVLSGEGFFDQEAAAKAEKKHEADSSAAPAAVSGYTESTGEAYTFTGGNGYTESTGDAFTFTGGNGYTESSEGAYTFSDDASAGGYSVSEAAEPAPVQSAPAEPASAPAVPSTPPSVNITVGADNGNLMESEFNDLRDSLAAAAAAVEKSMNKK